MSVIKNSFIYFGTSIFSKSVPFLLLPFLTKYLTKEEFGVLSIFLVFNSLYGAVVGMSIHANVTKNFYLKEKKELAEIIGNAFIIIITFALVIEGITYAVSSIWNNIFSIPSETLLVLPFLALSTMINQVNLTVLRNQGKAYMFGLFEITNALLNLIATIVFLYLFQLGWYSQVLGLILANMVLNFLSVVYLYKNQYLEFKYNKEKVISILKLSLPLIPHMLGGVTIAISDRLFIENMVGLEAVALYSVGYSFGMLTSLFVDAFIKAWSPWFYKTMISPDKIDKSSIVRYTYFYIGGVFFLAVLLSVISNLILPYAVSDDFLGAKEFIIWVAIGYAFRGGYVIFFPYLVYMGRTKFLAVITVFSASINLVFNYFFILEFGAIGAAYATIISWATMALLVFLYQLKRIDMPWRLNI